MRRLSFFVCSIALLTLAGCGGGNDNAFPTLPPAPGGASAPAGGPPANATATIKGKMAFEGTVPAPQKIQMSADPYCQQKSPNSVAEDIVLKDGGLQNVILYVSSGLPAGASYPTPTNPVTIDQRDCHYVPHVFTVQVNQPIVIKNSDATLHNIHAWAEKNTPFNIGQAVQNMETKQMFANPEMPLPIRCDVHKWMNSFAGVFDHPFHTISQEGGTYELKLPAGKYEITAWHEKLGMQTQMVEVADNGSADLNFTFKAPTGD